MRRTAIVAASVLVWLTALALPSLANGPQVPSSIRLEALTGGIVSEAGCAVLAPLGTGNCTGVRLFLWSLPIDFHSSSGDANVCRAAYGQTAPADAQPATCSLQNGAAPVDRGYLPGFSSLAACSSFSWTFTQEGSKLSYVEYGRYWAVHITSVAISATSDPTGASGVWNISISAGGIYVDDVGMTYDVDFTLSGSASGTPCGGGTSVYSLDLSMSGGVTFTPVVATGGGGGGGTWIN